MHYTGLRNLISIATRTSQLLLFSRYTRGLLLRDVVGRAYIVQDAQARLVIPNINLSSSPFPVIVQNSCAFLLYFFIALEMLQKKFVQ